jgi:hypothetical protein
VRALALLAVGGVAGGLAVYALTPGEAGEPAPRARVQTLRDGDVIVRREAAVRCEASVEGGFENLYCTRLSRGRYSFAFYEDSVLVYGPRGEPTDPDFSLRWKARR